MGVFNGPHIFLWVTALSDKSKIKEDILSELCPKFINSGFPCIGHIGELETFEKIIKQEYRQELAHWIWKQFLDVNSETRLILAHLQEDAK